MKRITTFVNDKEIEIYHATSLPAGYGHRSITVELYYNGEYKKFRETTNNMYKHDQITELEGADKYHALYELIEVYIIDEVAEWIESFNN